MAIDINRPRLVSVVALDGRDEQALLVLVSSLARGLNSPLATAILETAFESDIHFGDAERVHDATTTGVAASVSGHGVVLGTSALFTSLGIPTDHLGDWPQRLRQQGQHVLFVAIDGRTAGVLGIVDADL